MFVTLPRSVSESRTSRPQAAVAATVPVRRWPGVSSVLLTGLSDSASSVADASAQPSSGAAPTTRQSTSAPGSSRGASVVLDAPGHRDACTKIAPPFSARSTAPTFGSARTTAARRRYAPGAGSAAAASARRCGAHDRRQTFAARSINNTRASNAAPGA